MLNAASVVGVNVGEMVAYTYPNGMVKNLRVSSVSDTSVGLDDGVNVFYVDKSQVRGTNPPVFLDKLRDNQWQITSFDQKTRIVCIDVTNNVGEVLHITVTLPVIDYTTKNFVFKR